MDPYTPSTGRVSGDAASDSECNKGLREIGHLAVWSVSSAKPGNGVDALRDGSKTTYWQSDGVQPHLVNIQFQRKVDLAELHLHLDYKIDESYTPSKISIRAGSGMHDLREVRVIDMDEPSGCIKVPLMTGSDGQEHAADMAADDLARAIPLRAFFLQVAVLSNHQNGRDTHVRLIHVYGPRTAPQSMAALSLPCSICTPEFAMYATVR